jgi:hypothetical protein
MSGTPRQTTNAQILDIRTNLTSLLSSFSDNKDFINLLLNAYNVNSGTDFEMTTKKIIQFKIPYVVAPNFQEYIFWMRELSTQFVRKALYSKYKETLYTIRVIANVLNDIVKKSADDISYTNIKGITIEGTEPTDKSGWVQLKINLNVNDVAMYDANNVVSNKINIYYQINANNQLTIYNYDSSIVKITSFEKNSNYQFNTSQSASKEDIVKNYCQFLLSFSKLNLKRQLYTFYYLIEVLFECFRYYDHTETFIARSSQVPTCDYFDFSKLNHYAAKLLNIEEILNTNITIASQDNSYGNTLKGKVIATCPVKFEFQDTSNITSMNGQVINKKYHSNRISARDYEKYLIEVSSTTFPFERHEINEIKYITTTSNIMTDLSIKANISSDCSQDAIIRTYKKMNVVQNQELDVKILNKTADNLKEDLYNVGSKLNILNQNIQDSKDKINSQVKTYDAQNSILKALDTRQYVYYVIYAIISVLIIILLLIDTQQSIKLYASLVFVLALLAINIVNYYYKYDYIEPFAISATQRTNAPNCNNVDTEPEKFTLVNYHNEIISALLIALCAKIKIYVTKLDSIDVYLKLSGSLKNEQRTFEDHTSKFKMKEEINSKSIDIMKHQMIEKTGYMNLLSISVFVIVIIYTLYVINPEYLQVYLIVGLILLLINMAIYYVIILHPVRTRARNKYWLKPSQSVLLSSN